MNRYGQMRTFRIAAVVALCVSGAVLAGGLACSSSSQDGEDQSKEGESARASADLVAQVNAILQLRSSDVVTLVIDETPGAAATVNLPIAGEQYTLDLHPQSVRAANYQVMVQLADGSLVEVEPGPARTLRGTVVGVEGSAVAASMEEDGLHARIFLSDDEQYWVEPVASRVPQAGPNHYVVYHNDDIIAPEKACGLDHLPDALGNRGVLGTVRQTRAGACGTGLCVAELAADADVEYFQAYGSVGAVETQINSVVNAVNIQYERDVDITHLLTTIIVRTAEPDPYTHTDAVQLLFQFREHWLTNHGNIQRDTAQLFTGRNLGGSTIGVAWLNAICTGFGFSVVQSDFNNNFGCTTDLTAHELGHNWGADHCSCSTYTMNSFITCANRFHPTDSILEINAFRDTRLCLEGAAGCTTNGDCDDANACTTDTCTDGTCSNTAVADNTACTGGVCCGGTCTAPVCSADAGCNDANACTTDTCNSPGSCSASCSNDTITLCVNGDGCCPTGCTPANDNDCTDCGNGTCDSGEDCTTCPADCISGGGGCGDGVCEGNGEDCFSCPGDCRCAGGGGCNHCCGDNACTGSENQNNCPGDCDPGFAPPVGSCCGDLTCEGSEDSSNCGIDCGPPPVCGNGTCDPGEDQCNCVADCGAPSSEDCTNGVDDDCDGLTDCDDSDCSGDPACSCGGNRSFCTSNSDCCSNNCKNGTCRGN